MMVVFEMYKVWKAVWDTPEQVTLTWLAQAIPSIIDGCWLMVYILIPTLVLELWSHETAIALYKKNPRLYTTAVGLNVFNHFVLGMPCYVLAVCFLARDLNSHHDAATSAMLLVPCQVLITIVIHSLCFYHVHKILHTIPKLYKWHKFHHLFNTLVTPITANAVSPVEYALGYLAPFCVSMLLLRATETSLWISIQVISMFNLIMHTPKLQYIYDKDQLLVPKWMVSTADHLEHHKRLNCHYAAPTLDIDYLADLLSVTGAGTASSSSGGKMIQVSPAGGTNKK